MGDHPGHRRSPGMPGSAEANPLLREDEEKNHQNAHEIKNTRAADD